MLEGAKVRLEMSIEQMRKENRREVQQRDEELEEVRISAQKKVKGRHPLFRSAISDKTLNNFLSFNSGVSISLSLSVG